MRDWLAHELRQQSDVLYAWAASVLDALGGDPEALDTPALADLRRNVVDTLDAYLALGLTLDQRLPEAIRDWHRAWRA